MSLGAKRSEYAAYAMRHQGDARRGKSLFQNEKIAACTKCHTVDGSRQGAGPDLFAVGDKFERRDLITAVLEPSSRIAVGYGSTIVQTDAGKVYIGVLHRVTDQWIELLDPNSQRVRIPTGEIVEQQISDVSLMPEGVETTMTLQEFTDLVAYLGTLKQGSKLSSASSAARDEIPPCAEPAKFVSFFDDHVRLDHPVWFGPVPGSNGRFVVLEHFGKSWLVEQQAAGDKQTPFLDLSGVVRPGGATGLLGMAFHPKFHENRRYFLKYQIVQQGQISTVVEEREFAADGNSDSGAAPRRLLNIPSVTQDHNGGCIEFGPDGYLYIGMGDTGPQGDPQGHGQDLRTLLGKILRIDVDHTEYGKPYAIPRDNPFQQTPGARPEIWAYGFREPWRFSFDLETSDLWVGDVGQDRFEEVAIVRVGENHGWNVYEGFSSFADQFRSADAKYAPPVMSYPRRLGVSVTGGYTYRGRRAVDMQGAYIFGDFESRRIWALRQKDGVLSEVVEIGRCPTRVVSFTRSDDGEIFVVGYDAGVVYRLDLEGVDMTPLVVNAIAETSEQGPIPWRFSFTGPADDWFNATFDDSSWSIAPGGFGTDGTPGAIVRTDWRTNEIWLRREFYLPAGTAGLQKVALRVHHDEDAEVYLNGVEIDRFTRWTSGYVDIPLSDRALAALRSGRNVIAIHCRQQSGGQYIDAGLIEYVESRP
ncbi:MAG: PQQ-dependent sugar dehydrogenase [Pirellulales bacterium]|nr:PQQ-dependent sugar dehydrogenase [Pirellulales bacterium]